MVYVRTDRCFASLLATCARSHAALAPDTIVLENIHLMVLMQIYMCHQVQPCALSPPPLQLFGSANTDAARVATLGGLLQSALQKMTASIMIWLQNPSEAVPARSLPNPVGQPSSTQPGAGDTACPLMATSHECALNDAIYL